MEEQTKEQVVEEPVAPEEKAEATKEEAQEQPKAESPVDRNWEATRELLRLQKQRIEELESFAQAKKAPPPEEPDEFDKLDPEDYLTVAKARELARRTAIKEAREAAKKAVEEYAQQQTITNDEARARSKYEDYDYVIENYAVPLIKNDPALAYRVQNSKNPAETAYKLGKLSDSYEETVTKGKPDPKAEKILKNTSRPVSSTAVGSSLKSQADQFSKMSKQEIWDQAQKFARQA